MEDPHQNQEASISSPLDHLIWFWGQFWHKAISGSSRSQLPGLNNGLPTKGIGRVVNYLRFLGANVYVPCDAGEKQSLWNSLSGRLQSLVGERVCVCEDFNAVRSVEERHFSMEGSRSLDHIPFSRFIDENVLIDLPMSGRKLNWYKGGCLSMSRLDMLLLSEEWVSTWPNCTQMAQLRGLSDHCPLVLMTNDENWGPLPSRMLKCWKDIPDHNHFVRDKWNSMQVDGWGG
ncbi:hypothetical protein TSUD_152270 [Trifolium subterraneum]|uniref:Endonuclease/exonuclease/phosphatase domain-containing protein n=1 Tax=Trifolium subterraneum TaxID=3900 RepID=A0A2Z6NM93_TRISU|nr:hypothetical protein TSUD_152270 [Trifolium subterraneum]